MTQGVFTFTDEHTHTGFRVLTICRAASKALRLGADGHQQNDWSYCSLMASYFLRRPFSTFLVFM